jgi:hypothetical protein
MAGALAPLCRPITGGGVTAGEPGRRCHGHVPSYMLVREMLG